MIRRDALKPKLGNDGKPLIGANGKPMHYLLDPPSIAGKMWIWRYLILRRFSQFTILLLFFATFHWGWTLWGQPVLTGNLSGSKFLGVVPMADPFAVLQIFVAQYMLDSEVLIGAAVILALYALLAGRAFCSWVCPLNMVTDLASWLRRRFDVRDVFRLSRNTRYLVLGAALVLSAITGVAAFEWVSPIAMFHRELIFGIGMGWMAILGVFVFELFILKHGWCGHLCPLGAFYSLVGGRTAQLKVHFDKDTCTHCGECTMICPEPQVLNLKRAGKLGTVGSECTNCGRCTPVCPEGSLSFAMRYQVGKRNNSISQENPTSIRRAA